MSDGFLNLLFNYTLSEDQLIVEHAVWLIFNLIGEDNINKGLQKSNKELILQKLPGLIKRSKELITDFKISEKVKLVTMWLIGNILNNSSTIIVNEVKLSIIN